MIIITRKEDCVGCDACVQRCPMACISMREDEQGFRYPFVDINKCIDCHLCEKVCPVLNQCEPHKPIDAYAAKNKDKGVRLASSSGGIFFELARTVISNGGIVFGARFDEHWGVVHGYAETLKDAEKFIGSKYVQSLIGDSFSNVEEFLKLGRRVMFTGTPCQIAGLRLFLRKEYGSQLLTVDVVCHGVPSPLVWREYLKSVVRSNFIPAKKNESVSSLKERLAITSVKFRDKRLDWENFGFSVCVEKSIGPDRKNAFYFGMNRERELLFERSDKNLFMLGFLNDIYLRPSCYACPAKCGKSQSDITLADFWGISSHYPELYDELGVSLVLANTGNGNDALSGLRAEFQSVDYSVALEENPVIERSAIKNKESDLFWNLWRVHGVDAIRIALNKKRGSLLTKIYHFVIIKLRNCLNFKIAIVGSKKN